MRTIVIIIGVIFIVIFCGLVAGFMAGGPNTSSDTRSSEEWIQYISSYSIIYEYDTTHKHESEIRGKYLRSEYTLLDTTTRGYHEEESWEIKLYYQNGYDIWSGVIVYDGKYSRDSIPRIGIYVLRSDGQRFIKNKN